MSLNTQHLENEIIDQYLYYEHPSRPWIIGFSGGKDSTMLLQIVWNALKRIEPILLTRQIYVVCNDTLVENPRIVKFISKTLKRIQQEANLNQFPIIVHQTMPNLENTFWVKLIGLGYPAPNKFYRWCTERLKIDPTTRFIKETASMNEEAIILLGTRSDESSNRAASIKKHEIKGQRLRKHLLPNVFVYAPIKDVTTNEVWQYLNQVPPPWGGTHKELVTLYRNANAGDCPLVIDDTTPSCGNSRFGCWTCTVVNKDKSMEGLIDNGFETRVEILKRILKAQKQIEASEGIELITHQEMVLIQYYWFRDSFFRTKVSQVYNSIFKTKIDMSKQEEKYKQEADLLKKSCNQEPKDVELIQDLLALQKTKTLMIRKRGLQSDIDNRLNQFIEEIQNTAKE